MMILLIMMIMIIVIVLMIVMMIQECYKYMSVQELPSTNKLFRSLKIKVKEKT